MADNERAAGLREAAEICDALNGKQFALIAQVVTETAKHMHGAKVAMAMECAAFIRARAAAAEQEGQRELDIQPDKVVRIKDYFAGGEQHLALAVALDWIKKLEDEISALRSRVAGRDWGCCWRWPGSG